jgi:ABC-type transport system substrate-binding protein
MKMPLLNTKTATRRRFVGSSVLALALMQFGVLGAAHAQTSSAAPADPAATTASGVPTSFGPLKHVDSQLTGSAVQLIWPVPGFWKRTTLPSCQKL